MRINPASRSHPQPQPGPPPRAGEGSKGAGNVPLRLLRDTRGVTAMLVAVTIPVLFLAAGLGIDTGAWFTTKRQIQSAADAAALSAAYEVKAGSSNLVQAATEAARQNYYTGSAPTLTCAGGGPLVCYPYPDSLMTALGVSGVEVILDQPINSTFASWALPSVTIATKAVAIVKALNNACLLALAPTGTGIGMNGIYSITMPNCTIAADSTSASAIDNVGIGCIQASTLVTPSGSGGYSFTGISSSPCTANGYDLTSPPQSGTIPNPYAGTLTHTFLTAGMPTSPPCTLTMTGVVGIGTYTYSGNCVIPPGGPLASMSGINTINLSGGTQIDGGMTIAGTDTINLSPGTYWITNGNMNLTGIIKLDCPTCTSSMGVTIIFTNTTGTTGTLSATGIVTTTLNAPSSGTYAGYLMLQDPDAPSTAAGQTGIAGSTFTGTGLLYFPSTAMTFVGIGNTTASCLVAVANTFNITGIDSFDDSGCPTAGLSTLPGLTTVVLAE